MRYLDDVCSLDEWAFIADLEMFRSMAKKSFLHGTLIKSINEIGKSEQNMCHLVR